MGSKELIVSFSSQFCVQSSQICSFESDMVGLFTPWKSVNSRNQDCLPGELIVKYLTVKTDDNTTYQLRITTIDCILKKLRGSQSSSREGNGTPLQYSCLENPMDGGAWWASVHWVVKSWTQPLDTTERLHLHFSLSCIGEGNGNSLQCSCLENPRDGGARWAAIYGVAQSRTRLKQLSSSSSNSSRAVPC